MPELGKAYVQIVPSAQGISGSITNVLKGESSVAGIASGGLVGKNLVSTLVKTIAALGIGKAIKDTIAASLSEGAALEQSIGGIETLFKDNAGRVIQYAKDAYKTAGLSANDYMQQVTSFSASLLQSLGGDTKAAGDAANQAIIDMADNANKMGTSMESIQNAYQGFAKQNYTMLDNLKLGYGGTKTEMERLLKDAQEISGIEYNIDNLSDVYSAIHVIQEELGITGTTAKEASETFSGSFASMKAAAKNLLGSMALGEDVSAEIGELIDAAKTFLLDNALPMIGNIIGSIPSIIKGIIPKVKETALEMMNNLTGSVSGSAPKLMIKGVEALHSFLAGITERLPEVLDKGIEIIKNIAEGIWNNLPAVITTMGAVLNELVAFILANMPTILKKGAELVTFLAHGIAENFPRVVTAIGKVLLKLLQTIIEYLPDVLEAGWELIKALANGITEVQDSVIETIANLAQMGLDKLLEFTGDMLEAGVTWINNLITGLLDTVGDLVTTAVDVAEQALDSFLETDWLSVGSNIISGIIDGIWGAAGDLFGDLKSLASQALNAAKNALGIKSPSKLFRDQIGKFIPEGIAVGIDMNADAVDEAVAALGDPSVFDLGSYSIAADTDANNARNSQLESVLIMMAQILDRMDEEKTITIGRRDFARLVNEVS